MRCLKESAEVQSPGVRDKKRIAVGAFLSMGLLGMSRTFLGTTLHSIRTSFELNILQAGTFPALLQLDYHVRG